MQNNKNKQELIQEPTDFVETTIDFVEQDLAANVRRNIPNTLLYVAVVRFLAKEGRNLTANILDTPSSAVAFGADPAKAGSLRLISEA